MPPTFLAQARPGGKILFTPSGWLYGYARVLLTVNRDGTAEGHLLGGTVSFMSARPNAAPAFGNPAHWAAGLPAIGRTARHSPERTTAATEEAFHLRFLAQCAASDAQMTTVGDVVHLVEVVTGSAVTLTPREGRWEVREGGPVRLWEGIKTVPRVRRGGPSVRGAQRAQTPGRGDGGGEAVAAQHVEVLVLQRRQPHNRQRARRAAVRGGPQRCRRGGGAAGHRRHGNGCPSCYRTARPTAAGRRPPAPPGM